MKEENDDDLAQGKEEEDMLQGNDIYLRHFTEEDAAERLRLQEENKTFFERFSMGRPTDYYTLEGQQKQIQRLIENKKDDQEYHFGIYTKEERKLIGTINLFQVMRGPLQSAFIGYFLDQEYNGKGYTTEAVQLLVPYAFRELMLHRIEAGVMPHNIGSIRVLMKSGFHKEGLARKNVKINGQWEDHQVLAIINPND